MLRSTTAAASARLHAHLPLLSQLEFPPLSLLHSRRALFQPTRPLKRHKLPIFAVAGAPLQVRATEKRGLYGETWLDSILSVAELVFLVTPAVCSIVCLFRQALPAKVASGQCGSLACAVVVGIVLRYRQWQRLSRIYCDSSKGGAGDLFVRIGKVENDLESLGAVVRVLSRQLEKLQLRFRVTRRTMKDPITEAATLAQKNSSATEVLSTQHDILEKELGEVQKILLAMQEQQQKQLELILAIGKSGRLFEDSSDPACSTAKP